MFNLHLQILKSFTAAEFFFRFDYFKIDKCNFDLVKLTSRSLYSPTSSTLINFEMLCYISEICNCNFIRMDFLWNSSQSMQCRKPKLKTLIKNQVVSNYSLNCSVLKLNMCGIQISPRDHNLHNLISLGKPIW